MPGKEDRPRTVADARAGRLGGQGFENPRLRRGQVANGFGLTINPMEYAKEVASRELDMDLFQSEADYELRQMGGELSDMIGAEYDLRVAVYLAQDQYESALGTYNQTLHRGFRKL